jgi:uncharacterized protein (UPF0248 family)
MNDKEMFCVGDRVTIKGYYDQYRIVAIDRNKVKLQNLFTDYISDLHHIDTLVLYDNTKIDYRGS